jgi:hypothetical protein
MESGFISTVVIVNGHQIENEHGDAMDIVDDFLILAVGSAGGTAVLPFDEIVLGNSPTEDELL